MAKGIDADAHEMSRDEQQNIDILMLTWAVKQLIVDVASMHNGPTEAQNYVKNFGKSMDMFISEASKEEKPIDKAWREEMQTIRKMLTEGIKFD